MELSLHLADQLEAVIADQEAWPALLMQLADALGATEATFGGGPRWDQLEIYAPRTDPGYVGVYMQTYHQQNAFMRSMLQHSIGGRVISAHALPEFAALQNTDFYNLWCAPQQFTHMFGFSLSIADGWCGTMALNLSVKPDADQLLHLATLVPHVQRALQLHLLHAQLRTSHRSTLSVLNLAGNGGLLLDRHGRVLEANPIAEGLLQSGQFYLRDGRLRIGDTNGDQAFGRLLAQCLNAPDNAGGRVMVGEGPLSVTCAPFAGSVLFPAPQRPAVIVVINDPQRQMRERLDDLQHRYGLTRAEAELARAVVEAGSRKAAARQRGVTDATARAQLTSIFDKTGVRRQTDLVRLLMGGG